MSSLSRHALVTLAAVVGLAATSCGDPARPTSIFLTVNEGQFLPAPDELRISVYGDDGVLFSEERLPATGALVPLGGSTLGTVTLYLPRDTDRARLDVRSSIGLTLSAQATKEVQVVRDRQVAVIVTLVQGALPDTDGDGVPDSIDNCPQQANADQANAAHRGMGDACRPLTDGGTGTDGTDGPDNDASDDQGGEDAPGDVTGDATVDAGAEAPPLDASSDTADERPPTDAAVEAPADASVEKAPSPSLLTITKIANRTTVDLTAEGTLDWAHWSGGSTAGVDIEHKVSGGSKISDVQTTNVATFRGGSVTCVWSDGMPSRTGQSDGLIYRTGGSFTMTVAADNSLRTARLYVGAQNVDGRLTASLSDGSAPMATLTITGQRNLYDVALEVTFRAASAQQTVTISWAPVTNGQITIRAATLH